MKRIFMIILMAMSMAGFIVSAQEEPPPKPDEAKDAKEGNQRGDRPQRGGFDPQRLQQMFMERIKESLGVKDEEWNELKPLVEKVMTLSREARSMGGGIFGQGRRRGAGGDNSEQQQGEVSKASQALQKLLENENATPDDIKNAVKALRDARKKAEEELRTAKADLLGKLTPRQEARLVLMGLLD